MKNIERLFNYIFFYCFVAVCPFILTDIFNQSNLMNSTTVYIIESVSSNRAYNITFYAIIILWSALAIRCYFDNNYDNICEDKIKCNLGLVGVNISNCLLLFSITPMASSVKNLSEIILLVCNISFCINTGRIIYETIRYHIQQSIKMKTLLK